MVVLIDTNVIIDFLIKREGVCAASTKVIEKCARGELQGYIAFHSISNLWYILRRSPVDMRRKWLMDICRFLKVVSVSHEEVVKAIKMDKFEDFEDCLQDRCAEHVDAEYVITRNVKDFANSKVPAILPEEFLERKS